MNTMSFIFYFLFITLKIKNSQHCHMIIYIYIYISCTHHFKDQDLKSIKLFVKPYVYTMQLSTVMIKKKEKKKMQAD